MCAVIHPLSMRFCLSFLLLDVQEVNHPHLQFFACLEHEPDMLGFALAWQRLHDSLGNQIDYSILS